MNKLNNPYMFSLQIQPLNNIHEHNYTINLASHFLLYSVCTFSYLEI